MDNGVVLMTCLPPTRGHLYLIEFASQFMASKGGTVTVLLCSRDVEPISGATRIAVLKEATRRLGNVMIRHLHDDAAPQTPQGTELEDRMFWEWWKTKLRQKLGLTVADAGGFVFASDLYGDNVAKVLGWEFIPCNTYRQVVNISGIRVRSDPIANFSSMLPAFQRRIRRTVTFFGPESCGKTTMSKVMAEALDGYWVPEWAREYMEVLKTQEITAHLMDRIVHAQHASQEAVQRMENKPFIFQDTDLLSTLGFYKLYGLVPPTQIYTLFKPADLYILMNDKIPFTPDFLRLGGDRRETDSKFWLDLLRERGLHFHIVRSTYREDQEAEIKDVIVDDFMSNAGWKGFKR